MKSVDGLGNTNSIESIRPLHSVFYQSGQPIDSCHFDTSFLNCSKALKMEYKAVHKAVQKAVQKAVHNAVQKAVHNAVRKAVHNAVQKFRK